jgi:cell division protein FtsQ
VDAPKGNSFHRLFRYILRHGVFLTMAVLVLSAVYGFDQLQSSNYFPIKTVRVVGLNHLDKEDVKHALDPLVRRGFFSINVEYIRDQLQQMPWVSEIVVRRAWPDHVEIMITEKKVAARWNKGSLLSTDGNLFIPRESSYPSGLADFIGPDGQQITMLKYFVNINRILQPLHAKISYLELTPYLTWKLKLDNGMTLKIGHNDILTRLTHFVKVYPKIIGERAEDVEYIDLRYPNGMAVRWKDASTV